MAIKARLLTVASWSLIVAAFLVTLPASASAQGPSYWRWKMDRLAEMQAQRLTGWSRVIVKFYGQPDSRIFGSRGVAGPQLGDNLQVGSLQNRDLVTVALDPRVEALMLDRLAFSTMQRVNTTTGASDVKRTTGLSGDGVGVAIVDSGVSGKVKDLKGQIAHFKDFTQPARTWGTNWRFPSMSDPYGHGTHVAGIVAGTGEESDGRRQGIAPGAHVVSLKVLDKDGFGYVSNVIRAIDYAISIRRTYNLRVLNLSVGAAVFESYANDPYTLAAKRAVSKGLVVVAAAGNFGQNDQGETQFGGITAPGNAPWVLTVGASSHEGSDQRSDDTIADFSSRGPTWINFMAKPDLVAPGVGIESIAVPGSTLYTQYADYLVGGSKGSKTKPYLSLSGTSMAAPVVSGAVALMLEANPDLTPNAVKAILQYTAQVMPNAHALSQGAGQLNIEGAVRLATYLGKRTNVSRSRGRGRGRPPVTTLGGTYDIIAGERVEWSKHIIWGNYRITGGQLLPGANYAALNQDWGKLLSPAGDSVVFGADDDANIVWSTEDDGNIVWSTDDSDMNIVWSTDDDGNIVWSTTDEDGNIVWSTDDDANIVWSTEEDGNIVWSTGFQGEDGNIVWSTDEDGNIVWSTTDDDGNIVWSTDEDGNIVWSTDGEDGNIVWSTDDEGNIVWSTFDADGNIVWSTMTAQNVVWGNDCAGQNCSKILWGSLKPGGTGVWGTLDDDGNIVWSTDDDGNIVWSTDDDGNIVWSTEDYDSNIVWSTEDDGNIVWSTDDDGNIVWSTDDDGNIVWSTDDDGNIVWSTDDDSNIVWSTEAPHPVLWSNP